MQKFERPYKSLLDAGVKFYASLGNHDKTSNDAYKPFNMGGQGIVVEQGTHDDLLARGGFCAGPAMSASSPASRPIHPPTTDLAWRAR